MVREAVLGLLRVKEPASGGTGRTDQAPGEYCQGRHLEECRANFGEALARVCATCPD